MLGLLKIIMILSGIIFWVVFIFAICALVLSGRTQREDDGGY